MRQRWTIAGCWLVVMLVVASSASGQAGSGPCEPNFGERFFAFAGDPIGRPGVFCPQSMLLVANLSVSPAPPVSSPVGANDPVWQSQPGDEGDYVVQVQYQCEGGPVLVAEQVVTLISRLTVVGTEATQGVADAAGGTVGFNFLPGRRTMVRLFVEYDDGPPITYTSRMRGYAITSPPGQPAQCVELDDSPLRPMNAGGAHTAAPNALDRRKRLKSSLNFMLPTEWVTPGTFLLIEDEVGRPMFSNGGSPTADFWSGYLGVLQPPPPAPDGTPGANLDLRLLAIPWTDAQGAVHVANRAQMRDVLRRLRGGLPFPGIDYGRIDALPDVGLTLPAQPTDEDLRQFLFAAQNVLEQFRDFEHGERAGPGRPTPPAYHGVLVDRPEKLFLYGVGRTGTASVAFDVPWIPTTHLHELGHVLGLEHPGHSQFGSGNQCAVPCPAGLKAGPCCSCSEAADPDFPNIAAIQGVSVATFYDIGSGVGRREVFGLDLFPGGRRAPKPLSPFEYFEAMSYCDRSWGAKGQWLSDINWQIVTSGIETIAEDIPPLGPTRTHARYYSGSSDGLSVEMAPVIEVNTFLQVGVELEGEFTFRERDGSGVLLREGLFDVEPMVAEDGSGEQNFVFAVAVPYDPDVRSAEFLQQGQLIHAIDASDNPPTVQLLFPDGGEMLPQGDVVVSWSSNDADGDDLSHQVQLSLDDGTSWETLAVAISGSSIDVDTTNLPGSDQALIRVLASDGFWNASDRSDAVFEIVDGDPAIELLSPADGVLLAGEQLVTFAAQADDVTDGVLRGSSVVWSSSLDGVLGTDELMGLRALDMSDGTHLITVTATDSDGNSSQTQTTVTVEELTLRGPVTEPRVDLEVDLVIPLPPQRVGQAAAYEIAVRNWGRDAAANVTLDVSFPAELAAIGAVPTTGNCSVTSSSVSCSLGTLDPRGEVMVSIDATGQSDGAGTVSAVVSTSDTDVDPSDNQITLAATVRIAADPDMDGDGFSPAEGDCNDADPTVNPTAGEACNGTDDNCDGVTDETGDSLCFGSSSCTVGACDPVLGCVSSPLDDDVDGDGFFAPQCGGTDCDDNDIDVWEPPISVTDVALSNPVSTVLAWMDQSSQVGSGTGYDVISGTVDATNGFLWNGGCLATAATTSYLDGRPAPSVGEAYWYLVRAVNGCGVGDPGSPERVVELPSCP